MEKANRFIADMLGHEDIPTRFGETHLLPVIEKAGNPETLNPPEYPGVSGLLESVKKSGVEPPKPRL